MKQIFKSNIGMITRDVPMPVPGAREVLVKVSHSLISTGTETMSLRSSDKSALEKLDEARKALEKVRAALSAEGIKPTWERIRNKLSPREELLVLNPIGYSNAGTIVSKGNQVTTFNVGDRVACAGSGIAAHADYVTIPVNLAARIPDSLAFDKAAFTTVGSIALQGLRRANLDFGETVVVTGLGLLGLIAVQIAKSYGLVVIGIDVREDRIELARELGLDYGFLASEPKLEDQILHVTHGIGADAVVIYAETTSSEPANQALRIARRKGRVVVVGAVGMDLERGAMYTKELDFVISTSYGPGRYDTKYEVQGQDYPVGYVRWTENRNMQEVARLLDERKIDADFLISNIFPVEEASDAYDRLVESAGNTIAVLFSYDDVARYEEETRKLIITESKFHKATINVGVIGGGGFASRTHIPNLLQLPEHYSLVAISNRTPANAKMIGNKFKPRYVTTDYKEVLLDDDIDMVIVTTRHNLHAQITADALNAGKHVLLEKPLAMNSDELDLVRVALEKNDKCLTVGFNRRYSPLTLKAREIIRSNATPILINYRINAGYIPSTHWTQDPAEGGGRIIGELCHFVDLCNYLVDSEILDVDVSHIPLDGRLIQSEDNLVVTTTYKNGSVAVVTYVSIGEKGLPKERLEVFANKACMVINDFVSLEMHGTAQADLKLGSVDKGQLRELEEFAKKIKGQQSLIPSVDHDILATEQTFAILRALQRPGEDE